MLQISSWILPVPVGVIKCIFNYELQQESKANVCDFYRYLCTGGFGVYATANL